VTFVVTVRFVGDPKKAHRALREDPELDRDIRQGIKQYGMIRCTRLVGDGQFIDIDEWPSEKERDAFVRDMAPQLRRWNELMGWPESETLTWRPAEPDEDF